jgi:acyl-CoA oxidase
MATTSSCFLAAWRIAKLWDESIMLNKTIEKATIGMIASLKAYVSERTREVARLGREMMGGNGIITDNYCIKAVNDAEVVYTYEVQPCHYPRVPMTSTVWLQEES